MADTSNLSKFLTDVADAIRTKKETTEPIPAVNFDSEILSIESGIDTSDATATVNNITVAKTAYVNGEKITGALKFAGIYTRESELPSGSEYHDTFAIINQKIDFPTRPGNYSDYCIINYNGTIYLMQFAATEAHKLYIQKSQYTWSTTNYGSRKTIYWWTLNTANNTWVTYTSGYSCGQMLENTSFANYIESTFQLIDIEDGISSRPVLRDIKERELILPELWLNDAGTWRKELVDTTDGNRDASKLLTGYSMYAYNEKISGTMPNNGPLEYNPTTTTQLLPAGYTSGGVINAVDATIDENIIPENIKKGVTILDIEGTAETGVMTQEDYDNCEQIADQILSGNFPYNYTEYIEFNGNQYTTLPYYFTNNMSYEIILQDLGSPTWAVLLGDGAQSLQLQYESDSLLYINRGGGAENGDYIRSNLDMSVINTFKQDLANFYINGDLRLTLGEGTTFTSTSKINIGVVEPTSTTYAIMKLFGFKLWDNNELICNLVPVRRLTDDIAGLYDKVNDVFYTSLTTTSFISGGDL